LTVLCVFPLQQWLPDHIAWPAAFLVAHSTNFFFNGQLWGVLKCYDLVRWERPRFEAYVAGMAERARGEPAIQALIAYGSLARAEWNPASDLDARIIRAPGWLNGLRACLFLMGERTRALAARFPLDVYVIDSLDTLGRLRRDEIGIDLIRWVESGEFPVNRRRSDDGW
jgi:predicted nucleotidyltransferase